MARSHWFESYMSRQRVVVNSNDSPYLPFETGVPQGSILLVFLFFINDKADCPSYQVTLFADDSLSSQKSG